jgi:hypothetical protein
MAILKMRDADGNIKSIAIMKGDKGDGVPDGGSAGQVVKKTAEGTEWVSPFASPSVVFSNADVSVNSATITKCGLYEVDIAYSLESDQPFWAFLHHKVVVSVEDLRSTNAWEFVVAAGEASGKTLTLTYDNKALSSTANFSNCLAEVKLLFPYTDVHIHRYENGVCQTCGEVNPKFEQVDAFASHRPILNADNTAIEWSGNWTLSNQKYEFAAAHLNSESGACWLTVGTGSGDFEINYFSSDFTGVGGQVSAYKITDDIRIGLGAKQDLYICWTAPETGTVKIGATDFSVTSSETNYNLALHKNGKQVFPAAGDLHISSSANNNKSKFEESFKDFTAFVKKGDILQFVCKLPSSFSYGRYNNEAFMPTVEYVYE